MNDKYFKNDIVWSRKKADSILREVREVMSKCRLHSACVIWVSPFGNIEHRVGYFPDYTDCEQYAKTLDEQYKRTGMTYEVYVDLGWL